jgi:predicted Zn-dependent protease
MSNRNVLTAVLAVLLLSACATSPTGRTQLMVVSEQSAIAASGQAYTEMLAPLAKEKRLNSDPALTRRLKPIVDRIVAQAVVMRPDTRSWGWNLQIIDDPKTVNAWAMAGGKMALYSGLVEQLKPSDDELAQVLAHEIAHALAKHSAEKMSVAAATNVGVQSVGVATGSPIAMQGSALLAALALSLPNSRSMESEADRIGIELAAKAGYDPNAAVTLWDKMAALGGTQPEFLSTHPSPASRKQELQALVPAMQGFYEQARH